jgi:hypothetical protein
MIHVMIMEHVKMVSVHVIQPSEVMHALMLTVDNLETVMVMVIVLITLIVLAKMVIMVGIVNLVSVVN